MQPSVHVLPFTKTLSSEILSYVHKGKMIIRVDLLVIFYIRNHNYGYNILHLNYQYCNLMNMPEIFICESLQKNLS